MCLSVLTACMSVHYICARCHWRSEEKYKTSWNLSYKQFEQPCGWQELNPLGERFFTLSHLSGPVYSSFYYKFDTLLEESWWIITTRKRNLKRFSHTPKNYLGSQAIRLTSQQGDLLTGDYWIKRLKGTRPAAHTQGNGVSPLTHAHTVALGHSSLHM